MVSKSLWIQPDFENWLQKECGLVFFFSSSTYRENIEVSYGARREKKNCPFVTLLLGTLISDLKKDWDKKTL